MDTCDREKITCKYLAQNRPSRLCVEPQMRVDRLRAFERYLCINYIKMVKVWHRDSLPKLSSLAKPQIGRLIVFARGCGCTVLPGSLLQAATSSKPHLPVLEGYR